MIDYEFRLKKGIFTEGDLAKALNCKDDKAHYIRFQLLKKGKITRVCKGMYRFGGDFSFPAKTLTLRDSLKTLNKKFCLTGSSLFSDIHQLYVAKGTAEQFSKHIETLGYTTLINPKADHIQLLTEKANIETLVIIRENNYFYSSKDGLATVEKAIIDYYFETTHNLMPDFLNFNNIFSESFDKFNFTALLKCALLRNQKDEIKSILKNHNIPREVKSVLNL